jgi:hypothetical protein
MKASGINSELCKIIALIFAASRHKDIVTY